MQRTIYGILMILGLATLLISCSDDDDTNPPATGTLTGTVVFHGDWPDSGTVQLSVFNNWSATPCSWCGIAPGGPPAYYTPASYFQDPDTTNGAGPDTIPFTITGITLGSYTAVAVGWRSPTQGDINCDEPVIGLFGAEWQTDDSLPSGVTFDNDNPVETINVNAYFDILPVPGCGDRGRIEGVVRTTGDRPDSGLTIVLTTWPYTPWFAPQGPPSGYYALPGDLDSLFRFVPPFGDYYLSVFTRGGGQNARWHGAYGVSSAAGDARPDAITISEASPAMYDLLVRASGPEPHWIAGTVAFAGTRPAEGLLLLLTTYPYAPEHQPQGPPTSYYPIVDDSETLFAFTGMAEGTYYVSLWNNVAPPAIPTFYGAHGYASGNDTDPDPIVISTDVWGVGGIDVPGHP